MQDNEYSQSQRPEVRGTEDGNQDFPTQKKQRKGTGIVSSPPRNDYGRFSGSGWGWGNPFGTFSGEVINRLILQAEERLKDFNESIEWYEKQSEKLKYELEELKELRQLHLQLAEETEQSHQSTEEE